MNLKNYTSSTPVDRSVSRIEAILVSIGASHISKSYHDGSLSAIAFVVSVNGNYMNFKVPAKIDVVEKVLISKTSRPRKGTLDNIKAQAERTAWKIVCDWVEIQATMVQLKQAEFIEVFLPYVYSVDRDKTFFESLKETNYKALLR